MNVAQSTTAPAQQTIKYPIARAFWEKRETMFANLWARWQDEREYEDFAEYAAVMKKACDEDGVVFGKATKRPMGCEFTSEGIVFRLAMTGTSYTYKAVRRAA